MFDLNLTACWVHEDSGVNAQAGLALPPWLDNQIVHDARSLLSASTNITELRLRRSPSRRGHGSAQFSSINFAHLHSISYPSLRKLHLSVMCTSHVLVDFLQRHCETLCDIALVDISFTDSTRDLDSNVQLWEKVLPDLRHMPNLEIFSFANLNGLFAPRIDGSINSRSSAQKKVVTDWVLRRSLDVPISAGLGELERYFTSLSPSSRLGPIRELDVGDSIKYDHEADYKSGGETRLVYKLLNSIVA